MCLTHSFVLSYHFDNLIEFLESFTSLYFLVPPSLGCWSLETVYGHLFVDSNPDLRFIPQDDFDPYDGRHGDYAPMMAQNMEPHLEFDQSNLSEYVWI